MYTENDVAGNREEKRKWFSIVEIVKINADLR